MCERGGRGRRGGEAPTCRPSPPPPQSPPHAAATAAIAPARRRARDEWPHPDGERGEGRPGRPPCPCQRPGRADASRAAARRARLGRRVVSSLLRAVPPPQPHPPLPSPQPTGVLPGSPPLPTTNFGHTRLSLLFSLHPLTFLSSSWTRQQMRAGAGGGGGTLAPAAVRAAHGRGGGCRGLWRRRRRRRGRRWLPWPLVLPPPLPQLLPRPMVRVCGRMRWEWPCGRRRRRCGRRHRRHRRRRCRRLQQNRGVVMSVEQQWRPAAAGMSRKASGDQVAAVGRKATMVPGRGATAGVTRWAPVAVKRRAAAAAAAAAVQQRVAVARDGRGRRLKNRGAPDGRLHVGGRRLMGRRNRRNRPLRCRRHRRRHRRRHHRRQQVGVTPRRGRPRRKPRSPDARRVSLPAAVDRPPPPAGDLFQVGRRRGALRPSRRHLWR